VHLAWRTIARCARGTRTGHDREARVQGIVVLPICQAAGN
jgi:hypothetical protein